MLTDKCKSDFERWAKIRQPFNFNKHTKVLTCFGKAFFELPEAFQISAITAFADDCEIMIQINLFTPRVFNYDVFDKDGEQLQHSQSKESRFEANVSSIKWFNDYYNKNF